MIRTKTQDDTQKIEPTTGRPENTGEQWLGRERGAGRRLWERLNPRHRKQLRVIAEALAAEQTHARLPDEARRRLSAAIAELDRIAGRLSALLTELARRKPPLG